MQTFTDQTSVNADFHYWGFGIGASASYTQETDSSSSISIGTTTSNGDTVPGPASSSVGVDHDYDIVWVWLNPQVALTVTGPNSIRWGGYSWNPSDVSANEMEVVGLYVYWLKNPSTIPANIQERLARSWDASGLGGLTNVDYASILASDPLAYSSFDPNSDTTGRFDLQAGHTFSYQPPPPGGQPFTNQYSVAATTTSTKGQGAQNTYQVGFSVMNDSGFGALLSAHIKITNTYTTTDRWSQTNTSGSTNTASLSITGPATSDNYIGPTQFQVWRDNIYGSYMFYPVQ